MPIFTVSLCSTNLELSSYAISTTDDFNVTVTVENTGDVDGKEVVQVYVTDEVSSVVTPNQFLAGFTKVFIPCVLLLVSCFELLLTECVELVVLRR